MKSSRSTRNRTARWTSLLALAFLLAESHLLVSQVSTWAFADVSEETRIDPGTRYFDYAWQQHPRVLKVEDSLRFLTSGDGYSYQIYTRGLRGGETRMQSQEKYVGAQFYDLWIPLSLWPPMIEEPVSRPEWDRRVSTLRERDLGMWK